MTESPVPESELDRATDVEYAAISVPAVLGVVFGALSVLAFLAEPLVAIPILGAVLSAVGLRRIRRSRGVLTGTRLAVAGLVLGVGVTLAAGGYHGWRHYSQYRTLKAIEQRARSITTEILDREYRAVFDRIAEDSPQRRAGFDLFRERLVGLVGGAGDLVEQEMRLLQQLQTDRGQTIALANMVIRMEHRTLEADLWFTPNEEGQWEFIGMSARETFESASRRGGAPPPALHGPFKRG